MFDIDENFQVEVQRCFPFIKGVYTSIRLRGYDMRKAMEVINTATKVCVADEMSGGNKELKEKAQ